MRRCLGSLEDHTTLRESKDRPGVLRRLERSIRKRRKRWIAYVRKVLWLLIFYPRIKAQLKSSFRLLEKDFPFDPIWYQVKYPDVQGSSMAPLMHFIEHGAREGRLPNRRFIPECYLLLAPEVASSGVTASLHFLIQGWREGRLTNWLDRYLENNFDRKVRERISCLLDLLLFDKNPQDLARAKKHNISILKDRLSLALHNRASTTKEPKVSIIIPAYNQVAYTLACATSLYESHPLTTFEVIIADDCSEDGTREIFKEFGSWIKVVRASQNLGFLRNCNHGAKMARGEFLVFLNNDMLVLPGWLDSMIETFKLHPRCGIVGSKLLNDDGTLQEAGGIFWNDGTACNYGRGSDPELPEFNYCRPVDYCSGASICIRKKDWEELRGFDVMYERAYCEDADICFRMRKAKGLETFYQPFSVGIHLEGVSSGTDTTLGEKAYQETNLKKFFLRWRENLDVEHEKNGQNVFQARSRSVKKKTILVADHAIPQHDQDAGSRSTAQVIDFLIKKGCNIIFWPNNLEYDRTYGPVLQKKGVYVVYDWAKNLTFALWIKDHASYIDSFLLSRPHVAKDVLPQIKCVSKKKIFFYGHDFHFRRKEQEPLVGLTSKQKALEIKKVKEMETEIWGKVDTIYYPNKNEVAEVKKFCQRNKLNCDVRLLPVFAFEKFNEEAAANLPRRKDLLIVAGFRHLPNEEGVTWFVKNVWPSLVEEHNELLLNIVGSNPPKKIHELADKNIRVTGWVSDAELERYLRSCRVSVSPLLRGAGMKGKVVEALAWGLPVVTTSIGLQGLEEYNEIILNCDDPRKMIQEINKLLKSDDIWIKRSKKSVALAKKLFSQIALQEALKGLY